MHTEKSKSENYFFRIFITIIGAAFIAWGLTTLALGFIGTEATAVITNIRREGSEHGSMIKGRYTYYTSYTFVLPDGKSVDGVSRYIGKAIYVKASGKSKVAVRYFSSFPAINALASDTKPGFGQLVLFVTGIFLIYIINRPPK